MRGINGERWGGGGGGERGRLGWGDKERKGCGDGGGLGKGKGECGIRDGREGEDFFSLIITLEFSFHIRRANA